MENFIVNIKCMNWRMEKEYVKNMIQIDATRISVVAGVKRHAKGLPHIFAHTLDGQDIQARLEVQDYPEVVLQQKCGVKDTMAHPGGMNERVAR
jgi:hypothetical protein